MNDSLNLPELQYPGRRVPDTSLTTPTVAFLNIVTIANLPQLRRVNTSYDYQFCNIWKSSLCKVISHQFSHLNTLSIRSVCRKLKDFVCFLNDEKKIEGPPKRGKGEITKQTAANITARGDRQLVLRDTKMRASGRGVGEGGKGERRDRGVSRCLIRASADATTLAHAQLDGRWTKRHVNPLIPP